MSLRDQLQTIYDQHGRLEDHVVEMEARDLAHPLHNRFEWDDSVAGYRFRLHQARNLIRSVKITYREADGLQGPATIRAYHSVPQADGTTAYKRADEIIEDDFTRTLVLRQMERAWKQLQSRYAHFAEFADMVRTDLEKAS